MGNREHFEFNDLLHELMQSLNLLQNMGTSLKVERLRRTPFGYNCDIQIAVIKRQVDQTTNLGCDPNCTKIDAWNATSGELN